MPVKENIIIEFTPKGDQAMVQAIKSLDKATRGLLKTQATLFDTTKRTKKQTTLYEKTLKKTTKSTKKQADTSLLAARNNRILGGSFAVLRSKLLIFNFAMALGIRQIVRFSEAATKVQSMERAFNSLAGGSSNASIALDKLQKATDGTMSSFDLFQQANNAMILGVTKNADEMAEMFDMAQRLGAALGKDTRLSVESLITGIGRQSRMMLDNIGIIVKADEAYKSYALELKKNADQLTDTERKQAFLNATIDSARSKLAGFPPEVITAQMTMEAFGASVENAQVELGRAFLPTLLFVAKGLTAFADALDEDHIQRWAVAIGVGTLAFYGLRAAVRLAKVETWSFTAALAKNPIGIFAVGLSLAAGYAMEYFGVFSDSVGTTENFERALEGLAEKHGKTTEEMRAEVEAVKALMEAQEKGAESLQQQLDILNATSEAEKMRIQLGHEASLSEKILIDLIVKKEESLKREKEAIKKAEKAAKERIKTMKAEAKAFQAMLDTITAAEFDLASAELELGVATGKVTKEQAKDIGLLLGFQKQLIDQFGDRVKISGDMKDIQNTLNTTLDEATDLESDLLGILNEIFMAQLKVNNVDSESVKILKEKIELLKGQNEAFSGFGAAFGALTSSLSGIDFSAMDELKAALSLDLDDPEKGLENQATLLQAQLDMRESFYGQMGEMAANFIQQEAAKNEQAIRAEANRELEALRQTRRFKRMSDKQKAVEEKKITDKANEKLKKQHKIQQGAAIASVWIDAIKASFHAVEGSWVTVGQPWVGIIMGLAALQTAMISSQKAPTFARGGDFIVPPGYPNDTFPMRVESGERVQITPKSEVGGASPSSSTININFSGNVLSQDFIENEAIPQIKEAVRRGADLGIA